MEKKIEELCNNLSEYLDIDFLPVKFDKINPDDSRLSIKDNCILINNDLKDNFIECAKCIVHEYRHAWQIFYVYEHNDKIALKWKEEYSSYHSSSESDDYFMQTIEIDAFAFTKYYIKRFLNIDIVNHVKGFDKILDIYIDNNKNLLELDKNK